VTQAWSLFYNATLSNPALYDNPVFQYDLVDITRQVIANAFIPLYQTFTTAYAATANTTAANTTTVPKAATTALLKTGQPLLDLLTSLDSILATNPSFLLSKWIDDAVSWTNSTDLFHYPSASINVAMSANSTSPIPNYTTENSTGLPVAAYYEYSARNQITLWGPNGNINDYASKSWAGLVSTYYLPRWTMFVQYCAETPYHRYNVTVLNQQLLKFELAWQTQSWGSTTGQSSGTKGVLAEVLGGVVRNYTMAGSGIFVA
jgi:alpha-N-acetylglucosaminidase